MLTSTIGHTNKEKKVNVNDKVMSVDIFDYGGKYGSLGYNVACQMLSHNVDVLYNLKLLSTSEYIGIKGELNKLMIDQKSQLIIWHVMGLLIQKNNNICSIKDQKQEFKIVKSSKL